jgi:hypothetical protein
MGQTMHEGAVVFQPFFERLGDPRFPGDVVGKPAVMTGNCECERQSAFFVFIGGESRPNTRVFEVDRLPVELRLKLARVFAEIVPQSYTVAPVLSPNASAEADALSAT